MNNKLLLLENYYYHHDGILIKCDNNDKYYLPNQENKVLQSLIKHSGRLISKQVLIEESWGHLDVSDESLTRCVYSLRKCLFDNGKEFIKSVYAKGYLLRSAEMVSKRVSRM